MFLLLNFILLKYSGPNHFTRSFAIDIVETANVIENIRDRTISNITIYLLNWTFRWRRKLPNSRWVYHSRWGFPKYFISTGSRNRSFRDLRFKRSLLHSVDWKIEFFLGRKVLLLLILRIIMFNWLRLFESINIERSLISFTFPILSGWLLVLIWGL